MVKNCLFVIMNTLGRNNERGNYLMEINFEQLFNDQNKIIHHISSGTALSEILNNIIISIEKSFSCKVYGSILEYNPYLKKFGKRINPSIPKSSAKSNKFMDINLYEEAPGTFNCMKKIVTVSRVEKISTFNVSREDKSFIDVQACWSTPILTSKNEFLGRFDVYSEEVREPDSRTLKIIESYTNLAAMAMKNKLNMKRSLQEMVHSTEVKIERNKKIKKNESMLTELKRALIKEEFEVFYQPYFRSENNSICGMEALIRWNHPTAGLLLPISFLDIAEETGFILEIEKWVLKQAILDMKSIQSKGFEDLSLSVNISAQQLENDAFPMIVSNILRQSSFPSEKLTLEVTERFLIKKDTLHILKQLKQLGIKISIDDFGTSYSSLQYLKDLPISELKIDRSFISNMDKDNNNQKIVGMIVLLGHQLDLNVVAEGVETKKQLQLLKEMECNVVQGFLFSKPISLTNFMQKYEKKLSHQMM